MRWTGPLAGIALLAVALYACDSATSGTPIGQDAGADSAGPDGGCCPPDPQPDCCMHYGGRSAGGSCGRTCDGMPVPSDPDWKVADDKFGCPRWMNPHDSFHGGTSSATTAYCGGEAPERDAGDDDAADASDD